MKKNSFRIAFFLISLLFFSCAKDNKTVCFSCDTAEDAWVKQNIDFIRTLDRKGFISKIPFEKQQAAYRALLPEQQYSFWSEKLDLTIGNEVYSLQEKNHLTQLKNNLKLSVFKDSKESEILKKFVTSWARFAYSKLNWDNDKIFLITNTFYEEREFMDKVESLRRESKELSNRDVPDRPKCNCNMSLSCFIVDGSKCDKTADCGATSSGCGAFWLSSCKGGCQGVNPNSPDPIDLGPIDPNTGEPLN